VPKPATNSSVPPTRRPRWLRRLSGVKRVEAEAGGHRQIDDMVAGATPWSTWRRSGAADGELAGGEVGPAPRRRHRGAFRCSLTAAFPLAVRSLPGRRAGPRHGSQPSVQ
jgi:hypothetical protein